MWCVAMLELLISSSFRRSSSSALTGGGTGSYCPAGSIKFLVLNTGFVFFFWLCVYFLFCFFQIIVTWPSHSICSSLFSIRSKHVTVSHFQGIINSPPPPPVRSTGACCRCGTRWSMASWPTGMTWSGSGSTFTPRSSCRHSPRRWAPLRLSHFHTRACCDTANPVFFFFGFFLTFPSILCCSQRLLWTRARTGRRRLKCSSRLSTCRHSSSPCRPCSVCKNSLPVCVLLLLTQHWAEGCVNLSLMFAQETVKGVKHTWGLTEDSLQLHGSHTRWQYRP